MVSYKLYQVYCIEEAATRKVTSFTEPTQCPLIHNDRTIDTNQTIIIDFIPIVGNRIEILTPKIDKISSKGYFDLKTNFYFDSSIIETITDIKIVSYFENRSGSGSYDFRVYNITANTQIGNVNLNNEILSTNDIGELTNLPTQDSILEFHTKVDDSRDKANINSIIIYYKTIK